MGEITYDLHLLVVIAGASMKYIPGIILDMGSATERRRDYVSHRIYTRFCVFWLYIIH